MRIQQPLFGIKHIAEADKSLTVFSQSIFVHAAHVFFRFIIRLIFPIFVLNGGHAVLNFADGRQYRLLIQFDIFSLGFFLQFDIIDQFAPMKNRQR